MFNRPKGSIALLKGVIYDDQNTIFGSDSLNVETYCYLNEFRRTCYDNYVHIRFSADV